MNRVIITLILNLFTNFFYSQVNDSIPRILTQELKKIASRDYINGFSVAIVNENGTLYEKGFGYADIKTKKKYTKNTIQNIASISKTFIGLALLKAQEQGKLNLDDPINNYLPFKVYNPYYTNELITIRQLASHSSSIKDAPRYEKNGYILKEKENKGAKAKGNFRSPDDMITFNVFLKNILNKEGKWYTKNSFSKTKPGTRFEYSNIGAGLAALIIENATNQPFNQFVNEYILTPLAIHNSGWSFSEIDFSSHSKLYLNKETELTFYRLANYPDGGFITSSSDLGIYLTELIRGYNGQGKILNKQNYEELYKPQLTKNQNPERGDKKYDDEYNIGVFMGMSSQNQIGHTGGDPGVATFMFFNKTTKIGKLLLVNTELKKEGIKEFIDIWKKLEEFETKF